MSGSTHARAARRRLLLAAGVAGGTLALAPSALRAAPARCAGWPAWHAYRDHFIQADGRVIDFEAAASTTSEGQAYTLFLALVAGDRDTFTRVLDWTRANLAGGDLTARLMAWQWGKRDDGTWGVRDANAASDADLWLAHTLFEAARLWRVPAWRATAHALQARIAQELVVDGGPLGPVLLPGPQGFALDGGGWRVNPSYAPLPLLRGLAREVPDGIWGRLAESTLRLIAALGTRGLMPDWAEARPAQGYALAADATGSYDAVRVYLWAGITAADDPGRAVLLRHLGGLAECEARLLVPPERVDARSGACTGSAPPGLVRALLPYFRALGAEAALARQRARLAAQGALPKIYYQQVLALFAEGWLDGRYRHDRQGRLVVGKGPTCDT